MPKRAYMDILKDIENILNKTGRSQKGYNAQDHFISLLTELKQDFKTELSTKYLFNLMQENSLNIAQKRKKLRNLLIGIEKKKVLNFWRDLDTINYKTDIKVYGYNKIGKAVLKDIKTQTIGKEFLITHKETLSFISV